MEAFKSRFHAIGIHISIWDSSMGLWCLGANQDGILFITDNTQENLEKEHSFFSKKMRASQSQSSEKAALHLATLLKVLEGYGKNKNKDFKVPIVFAGTDFQNKVWKKLQSIPYGQTTSYAELAAGINHPYAIRAVASAVGRNHHAIILPCHRVIGKNGALRGYRYGLEIKKTLLDLEKQ